jgi:hypothetical protein
MKTPLIALLTLSFVFLVLAVSGCVQNQQGPVCNPPYIAKGFGCCLDTDANSICDSDELPIMEPYCGDGTCDANEDCLTCVSDCGGCQPPANDTAKEIKAAVYDAVTRYVPKAAGGNFSYVPRPNITAAFDEWQYPQLLAKLNTSRYVIWVSIKDYHFGLGGPPDIYDKLASPAYVASNVHVKIVQNGRILVNETTSEFATTPPSGRYDYTVEFNCGTRYEIKIHSWDFYGGNISALYRDYDMSNLAIENAASEVLGNIICSS